jgi:4-hydroxy-3-methylbut-2-enyl diphosphate reductase
VIFSAHGVAPSEWDHAKGRQLRVIDATCPLVTKVHDEVERYDNENRTVILIGHAGHEEVKGTLGVAPGKVVLVGSVEEARTITVENPERIAAVTQTTLSVDDTREIMATLKERFPAMITPKTDDICYATQNRQNAVKELVQVSDAVLVAGWSKSRGCVGRARSWSIRSPTCCPTCSKACARWASLRVRRHRNGWSRRSSAHSHAAAPRSS